MSQLGIRASFTRQARQGLCCDRRIQYPKKKKKRILGFGVSQLGIRSLVNDYLGSSSVGIHNYGPDTSSSQLGIKS